MKTKIVIRAIKPADVEWERACQESESKDGADFLVRMLTDCELNRLENRIWRAMTYADGYQMYGYDAVTLRLNHPIAYPAWDAVCREQRRRQDIRSGKDGKR